MEADTRDLQKRIRSLIDTLTVAKLKNVLRAQNYALTGRKAELQERLLMVVRDGSPHQLRALEKNILRADFDDSVTDPRPQPTYTDVANNMWGPEPISRPNPARSYPLGGSLDPNPARMIPQTTYSRPRMHLNFNTAPFYRIHSQVSEPVVFITPHREHRRGVDMRIKLSPDLMPKLRSGELMLALLSSNITNNPASHPLYYPFNCTVSLNGMGIPTVPKTRGIKGVEGSATPLDLTKTLIGAGRAPPSLTPVVKFTFTINPDASKDDRTVHKSFGIGAYIVKQVPITALLQEVAARPRIPISEAIRIIKGDEDDDIVAMQAIHSLKDPITRTRMKVPIRSRKCDHVDCFDAEAFVTFLSQSPRWKCAHCNNDITWESMAVDDLMSDILKNTKESADKVSINEDGTWTLLSSDSDTEESDSDDEQAIKRHRPQPEIIDLLSDSDDDEVLPAPPLPPPPPPPVPGPITQTPLSTSVAPAVQHIQETAGAPSDPVTQAIPPAPSAPEPPIALELLVPPDLVAPLVELNAQAAAAVREPSRPGEQPPRERITTSRNLPDTAPDRARENTTLRTGEGVQQNETASSGPERSYDLLPISAPTPGSSEHSGRIGAVLSDTTSDDEFDQDIAIPPHLDLSQKSAGGDNAVTDQASADNVAANGAANGAASVAASVAANEPATGVSESVPDQQVSTPPQTDNTDASILANVTPQNIMEKLGPSIFSQSRISSRATEQESTASNTAMNTAPSNTSGPLRGLFSTPPPGHQSNLPSPVIQSPSQSRANDGLLVEQNSNNSAASLSKEKQGRAPSPESIMELLASDSVFVKNKTPYQRLPKVVQQASPRTSGQARGQMGSQAGFYNFRINSQKSPAYMRNILRDPAAPPENPMSQNQLQQQEYSGNGPYHQHQMEAQQRQPPSHGSMQYMPQNPQGGMASTAQNIPQQWSNTGENRHPVLHMPSYIGHSGGIFPPRNEARNGHIPSNGYLQHGQNQQWNANNGYPQQGPRLAEESSSSLPDSQRAGYRHVPSATLQQANVWSKFSSYSRPQEKVIEVVDLTEDD